MKKTLEQLASANLPTLYGDFTIHAFSEDGEDANMPTIALVHKGINKDRPVFIRLHSECLTGDVLGSTKCDCGEQLHKALEIIGKEKGVLLYLRQEGRGIGLVNKLRAYALQDEGMDTVESNVHLGFKPDERNYSEAIEILKKLGITKINLITNNPEKLDVFKDSGIELMERIPVIINPNVKNQDYLNVKKDKMGHLF